MNKIYKHPGQDQMQVEVILASCNAEMPDEKPLVTMRLRYPRIIHAEIMTHRVFSRNARSSRAVPVKTMLNEVRDTPFVPWHWGKNQKGMQADTECAEYVWLQSGEYFNDFDDGVEEFSREDAWLWARDAAVEAANAFMTAGYHKQLANRLLEPFSWIDTLITSTDWDNFLWLRDHKDAEPHLQDLARLVKLALDEMNVQALKPGVWHLPYITETDREWALTDHVIEGHDLLSKISASRCARISYKPFDGDASYERELERYDSLVKSDRVHASPLEHQATPDRHDPDYPNMKVWECPELHGNLTGWIQYRKLIPNEAYCG